MYFTVIQRTFLNDKHHKVSNLYGTCKIHKSKIIENTINTQNTEITEIFKLNDVKLRSIIGLFHCLIGKVVD